MNTYFYQRLSVFIFLLIILFAGKTEATEGYIASGPYCGVACLYVTMGLHDKTIDFANLIKPEYIGSRKGSSLAELQKAAKDNGLYAEVFGNFSSNELKVSKHPLILHVKSLPESKEYDHYILFLNNKDGKAMIFDPPKPVELVPYYKLTPWWDGIVLVVSAEPINLGKILAPARNRFAFFAGLVIAAIVLLKTLGKYVFHKIGSVSKPVMLTFSVVQSAGLVMVALLIGLVYHFVNDAGFLAHAGAAEPVVKASLKSFIPKVSAKDIENIKDSSVIIDARQTTDYDAGHIDGAINIPTTLDAAGRSAKLVEVAKDGHLIIYCQSAGCPYAEKVALNLMEDGFTNIAIYKGGWVDWQKYIGAKNETK